MEEISAETQKNPFLAQRRVYIAEAAELLKRRMATLRKWEYLGVLPDHLMPRRGERDRRYWTPEQIEGIREWIYETDRRAGKGLPYYRPTEQALQEAMDMMRRPRRCVLCKGPIKKGQAWQRVQGRGVHTTCLPHHEPLDDDGDGE